MITEIGRELQRRLETWPIYKYRPLKKPDNDQLGFHQDKGQVRVIIGSNRSGKTQPPLAEAAAVALGEPYPFWFNWMNDCPPRPPATIWIVIPFFNENPLEDARIRKLYLGEPASDINGNRIHKPPLIPPEMIDWHSQDWRHVKLVNGSSIDIKASSQQAIQLASANVDYIIFDEPTRGTHWAEATARLLALPNSRLVQNCTDTTLKTRYLNRIMAMPGKVSVYRYTTAGNPYRNVAQADAIADLMDDEERAVRIEGKRYGETLLAYPNVFRWVDDRGNEITSPKGSGNWIDPRYLPREWTRYVIHDPGKSNPAASVWFAVDPQGNIWAYKLKYWRKPPSSIQRLMDEMIEHNAGDEIEAWWIDPKAAKQPVPTMEFFMRGRKLKDMYNDAGEQYGVHWRLGTPQIENITKQARVACAEAYLDPLDTNHPMLWIFDIPEMEPLRYELNHYRWATSKDPDRNAPETTYDADNHVIYCMEAACAMPLRYYPKHTLLYDYSDGRLVSTMTGERGEGWDEVNRI